MPPALAPAAPDALFKSLADPTRRALFERLVRDGEQTVGALTAAAGRQNISAFSSKPDW
jgi:DNA-binding transcriptional ArsR family regulator